MLIDLLAVVRITSVRAKLEIFSEELVVLAGGLKRTRQRSPEDLSRASPRNPVRTVTWRVRWTVAIESALWSMPTISASARVRIACPPGDAVCRAPKPISAFPARFFAFVEVPAIQMAEFYLDKAAIDRIVAIESLLAAQY